MTVNAPQLYRTEGGLLSGIDENVIDGGDAYVQVSYSLK